MINHAPALIVLIPLTLALLGPIMGKLSKVVLRSSIILGFLSSTILSLFVLMESLDTGTVYYKFGNWDAPFGIEYVMDPLNSVFAVLVAFIAMFVAIYSREFFKEESGLKNTVYYSLLSLLVAGSLGMGNYWGCI